MKRRVQRRVKRECADAPAPATVQPMSDRLRHHRYRSRHFVRLHVALGLVVAFLAELNACTPATGDRRDTGRTPSGDSPSSGPTSGDSEPTSDGSPTSRGSDASASTPATSGPLAGGSEGDAGPEGACALPFEAGDCDGAIPVYARNAHTGQCSPQIYGGCGGNENRFATYLECVHSCNVRESGKACEVDGLTYPDGWTSVPDPFSCNTCECIDGEVNACGQSGCVQDCPAGTAPGTTCAVCGPTDACLVVETGCLPKCEPNDAIPCSNGGVCLNGLCGSPCG